jgi:predicted nucleotidyltransferase
VLTGLENVLAAYTQLSKGHARNTDNNPVNYRVDDVYVVGSGARENKVDSDLDLMLVTPKLDLSTCKSLQTMLALIFFVDREKIQAIDPYIRKQDEFPERESVKITDQVLKLLQRYNNQLV